VGGNGLECREVACATEALCRELWAGSVSLWGLWPEIRVGVLAPSGLHLTFLLAIVVDPRLGGRPVQFRTASHKCL